MSKHKIYAFNNGGSYGWMQAEAIGDDGVLIAGHVCSHEGFMPGDMGVTSKCKHNLYDAHFGEGNWEIEFVPYLEVRAHEGLQAAIRLNQQQAEAAKQAELAAAPEGVS